MTLNILMVIPSFYPEEGGAERQLKLLCDTVKNLDNNIFLEVVTRSIHGQPFKEKNEIFSLTRLKTALYPYDFLIRLAYHVIVRRRNIDIIHVHTLNSPAWLCAIIGKIFGIKTIVKVPRSGDGSRLDSMSSNLAYKFVSQVFFRLVSKVVAITDDISQGLRNAGCPYSKITKIPNGVLISPTSKMPKNRDKILCVCVGRLIERKKVEELIDIWKYDTINQNFDLAIIGDGPEFSRISEKISRFKLERSCKLYGALSQGEVFQLLSESKIFVHPSVSEGLSNALLEAMSKGNAIIARDIPANREILSKGRAGKLFKNVDNVNEMLLEYLENLDNLAAHSEGARCIISEHYSIEIVSKKYVDLYIRLTKIH